MITVRCPACGKVIGFDESDGGSLVACPHCREPFFVPAVAVPAAPVETAPLPGAPPPTAPPLPQAPALPDEIGVIADPDLDPICEQFDEVQAVEEGPPPEVLPATPPPEAPESFEIVSEEAEQTPSFEIVPDEPQPPPETGFMPRLELEPPLPPPPPPEPPSPPAEVKPTDLAPTRQVAEVLAEAVAKPIDVLDEIEEDKDEEDRERRRRSKPKRRETEYETPVWEQRPRTEGWPRRRIMGIVAMVLGFILMLGSLTLQLTDRQQTWPVGMCISFDVLGVLIMFVGMLYAIFGAS